jgi:hypothetical protein
MSTVHTATIRNPVDWLPDGVYLVPVVDNLTPCWVRVVRTGESTLVDTSTNLADWDTAPAPVAADALNRVANSPGWARATYGRQTGICGACGLHLDDARSDRHGIHVDCDQNRKALAAATRDEKNRVRVEAVAAVAAAWADVDQERQIRAVANVGPVTIEKLDDTSIRIATGLSAAVGPAPMHEIRDRTDPRIPSWAARVVVQLAALDPDGFAAAWHWVDVPTMRHLAVDLAADGPVERRVASCGDMAEAQAALSLIAADGEVLYASLSCQPGLLLSVSLRTGDVPR